jgi:hypothetical protein
VEHFFPFLEMEPEPDSVIREKSLPSCIRDAMFFPKSWPWERCTAALRASGLASKFSHFASEHEAVLLLD